MGVGAEGKASTTGRSIISLFTFCSLFCRDKGHEPIESYAFKSFACQSVRPMFRPVKFAEVDFSQTADVVTMSK